MFLQNFKHKKITVLVCCLLISFMMLAQSNTPTTTPASASSENNPLEILLFATIIVLVFVIWGMGQVLLTLSRQLMAKNKEQSKITTLSAVAILLLLSENVLAQAPATDGVVKEITNYGGVSANTFYLLVAVIATEIFAITFLFFSIRRIMAELLPEKALNASKESKLVGLWTKLDKKLFTKAIPIEEEEDFLLDHDYDGIQELDNSLPPWWKYGFIITIAFAFVYLLNFHVFGNGKNPTQEYDEELRIAKIQKETYEATNKDKIDESNVPMAEAAGVKRGQDNYLANCIACHGTKGEGGVGPNLTDDYWLHKGSLNDVYSTIKKGYPDKGMQSWASKFNPKEMSELASFVKSLKGTNPPNGKAAQGDIFAETGAVATPAADSLKTPEAATKMVKK